MAKKYFEVYGKPLTVTSAFRTPEEQAQISSGTNAKAEPGQSLHQRGMAIDVDRNDLKRLVDSQLLTAYGFSSIANDNVHMQYGRPPEGYNGGIFSGPLSGYLIKAHGDELITPLSTAGRKSQPLSSMFNNDPEKFIEIMTKIYDKMDKLVDLQTVNNATTEGILNEART